MTLEFEVECPAEQPSVTAGLVLYSLFDVPIVGASSKVQGISGTGSSSRWRFTCELGNIPLNAGTYYASIWFGNRRPRSRQLFSRFLDSRGSGRSVRLGQQGSRNPGATSTGSRPGRSPEKTIRNSRPGL